MDQHQEQGGREGRDGVLLKAGSAAERALHRAFAPVQRFASTIWRERLRSIFERVAEKVPSSRIAFYVLFYVLVVVAGAVLVVLRRVDAALGQMHLDGGVPGSALGFPVSFETLTDVDATGARVASVVQSWKAYDADVARPTVLRSAVHIARDLVVLDFWFVALYVLLLIVTIVTLYHVNARLSDTDTPGPFSRARYGGMLLWAGAGLAALVLVDIAENMQLLSALVWDRPLLPVAIGPWASLLKLVLAAVVLGSVILVFVTVLLARPVLLRTVWTARAVVLLVALLTLLLFFGIIAAQTNDVIRAWTGSSAAFAVIAALLLAIITAGVTRELSGRSVERLTPDVGRSSQPLLLSGGFVLLALGLLTGWIGLGWGLSVAGGLLLVLWLVGATIIGLERPAPETDGPAAAASPADAAAAVQPATRDDAVRDDAPGITPIAAAIADCGVGLGRFLGAGILAVLVWVIARAVALDVVIRRPVQWGVLLPPLAAVVVAIVGGVGIVVFRPGSTDAGTGDPSSRHHYRRQIWFWATVTCFAVLSVLSFDDLAVVGAQAAGSIAVIFVGFAFLIGAIGLLAGPVRARASKYRLPAALRVLGLRRFPVVAFVAIWILVVSVMDQGGYHDIRRYGGDEPGQRAPTIGAAWEQWVSAQPGSAGAHPMALVAAQGGGIRAAVWTALVMECIFGPGPVQGSGDVCAAGSESPRLDALAAAVEAPTPVFLASGASGGSVGIAAWSARRADLLQDGSDARIPRRVEDALSNDFVAPVVARMFTADLPYTLLAWNRADRAAMLERGWEQAWRGGGVASPDDPNARGLTRGMRTLWSVTHANGQWATPVLALNGVSVEDGCRMVASAVDFTLPRDLPDDIGQLGSAPTAADDRPDDAACRGPERSGDGTAVDILPSTSELVDYLCPDEDVPLATAAHLSARFPYVSPTGRVARMGCPEEPGLVPGPAVSYDADGGIFDNSGSGTLTDVWRALSPVVAAQERQDRSCFAPIVVQIDNSPPASTVSAGVDARPAEVLAPVTATLGQVTSRESYARARAAAAFTRPLSPSGRQIMLADGATPDTLWFRISLFGQPGPEPPTGWTLAPETVSDMRSQLKVQQNAEQITQIRALLADQSLTCG